MVIVIGGTGFIGAYTIERLIKDGYKVLATGRKEDGSAIRAMGADYVKLDITRKEDFDRLPDHSVEGVILLAGLLPANEKVDINREENAEKYFIVNVLGTINVLEYCRKNNIKKVISCTSYSDVSKSWKKGVALSENEPRAFGFTGDHAVYVISKNAASDVMEYYNQQHHMQCAWFRLPPVYGVGPHGNIYVNGKAYRSGIATFIDKAQKGEPIEIWGDPHIQRDIIYVKDVARAFSMALSSDRTYGLYNMTSGKPLELEEQVKATIEIFGGHQKSAIVYRPDIPNNSPSFLFDMSKAERDFGFVPEFTDYRKMMRDYKKEWESGKWKRLLNRSDEKSE